MSVNQQLWNTIHIVGKTFSPKNGDSTKTKESKIAFICFFDCLSDLLPNEIYKRTLKDFIKQTPPGNYLSSTDKAFQWTYELHSYVNFVKKRRGQPTNDITLERANSMYSSVTKTDWGNAFWFIIHYIAANLPEKLSDNYKTAFIAMIMSIQLLIPCDECKQHMANYISKVDIHSYMISNKTVFQYTWEFHNAVSQRLGKNTISFGEAFNMYAIKENYSMIE